MASTIGSARVLATNILLYEYTIWYSAKTPFGSTNFNRFVNGCKHIISFLVFPRARSTMCRNLAGFCVTTWRAR
jgi:hypothetical protein